MTECDQPPRGRVEEILAAVQPETREVLLNHLTAGTPSRTLASILTSNGYPIGKTAINNWRNRNAPSV